MCVYASSSTESSREEDQVTLCRFVQEPSPLYSQSCHCNSLFSPQPTHCMSPHLVPVANDWSPPISTPTLSWTNGMIIFFICFIWCMGLFVACVMCNPLCWKSEGDVLPGLRACREKNRCISALFSITNWLTICHTFSVYVLEDPETIFWRYSNIIVMHI